jgi:hypothetical protein
MAIVNGGLLSFNASGQIGKTLVFSRWKGRPYARQLVTPANPRSTAQTETRSVFTFLSNVWKVAPAELLAPWNAFAKGKPLTGRNAFMGQNVTVLRPGTDLTGLILSPGAAGGLTVAPTVSGGSGTITIGLTAPSPLPTGWTIVQAVGVAILEQDPHIDTAYTVYADTDDTSTYSIVLSGLAAGDYEAGGWFVYQRSALTTDLAYGASVAEPVTVT